MASNIEERMELAKHCSSHNWSKAIRVLDTLISRSTSVQDLCNRAFCYSRLELYKHAIKDCDHAIDLDSTVLQAYILKGTALSALDLKEDALRAWEEGYENVVHKSADLKQLLELEELLVTAKKNKANLSKPLVLEFTEPLSPGSVLKDVCSQNSVADSPSSNMSTSTSNLDPGSQGKDVDSENQSKCTESETDNAYEDTCESCIQPSEDPKTFISTHGNVFVAKSLCLDFRLTRGIALVNEGKYDDAISIFNKVLRDNPTYSEALIGRGTAYAFQRELEDAIADFTKAIHVNPLDVEAWKRRAQAHAALGDSAEAIEDLTKALEFAPKSSDILHEKGIVCYKFRDYNTAVADLSTCVRRDKKNKSAYTYLGLALSAIGEYSQAEEAHLKSVRLDKNFLEGWAHLTQFYIDISNSDKALQCINQALLADGRFAKAFFLRGLLYHGLGQHSTQFYLCFWALINITAHRRSSLTFALDKQDEDVNKILFTCALGITITDKKHAIKDLSLGLSIENFNIDTLYLRGSCYHAIGQYGNAVKDYDAVLDIENDSPDKFVLQCLTFYQKEIALYTASKINSDFFSFSIDSDIDPLFKEYWCKKLHPDYVCERVFRQPPLRDSMKKGRLKKLEFTVTKHKMVLLKAADSIGENIQYSCQGFLPNKRQYRMAGLAAIAIAQKVTKAWRSMKSGNKNAKKTRSKEKLTMLSQNRGGSCCSTSGSYNSLNPCGEYRLISSRLSWQGLYNVAVKWRQISEPCDPVVWINKLSSQHSEEFSWGFGSHTPMLLGQAKVLRYYPNYQRSLDVVKSIIIESKYANNFEDKIIELSEPMKLQKINNARSCSVLYDIVGENFWVATTCESTAFEGQISFTRKRLEGTRITVQKKDSKGFDFAIRTPCTPSRWSEYDTEMTAAWEALCATYCSEAYGSTDITTLDKVKDAILRMTYYWYNFMPLARGTSVVGYTVLLGLFLAANIEVTGKIPPGTQVDWDAIFSSTPEEFLNTTKSWLYPMLKINTSWKGYPDVTSTFDTTGSVVAALSHYDD